MTPRNIHLVYKFNGQPVAPPPSVSASKRILSPGLFIKRFDAIRDCLQFSLGLTTAEREVMLRLLQYWAYYGRVYPKERSVTAAPGCSKATYWRAVRKFRELGLLLVINRYVIRQNAQISNFYCFERLAVVLARYLAEHGAQLRQKWLQPYLQLSGRNFWSFRRWLPSIRAGPVGLQPARAGPD